MPSDSTPQASARRLAPPVLTFDATLEALARLAAETTSAPLAHLWVPVVARRVDVASRSPADPQLAQRAFEAALLLARQVVASGEEHVLANGAATAADGPAAPAFLGVPIRAAGGEVVGACCVIDVVPHPWTAHDRTILTHVAAVVSHQLAFRGALLGAYHDALTAAVHNEEHALALNSVSDGVVVLDRDWRVVYVNDVAVGLSRRTRDEFLGHSIWEVFPDLVGTLLERRYREAMDQHVPITFEWRHDPAATWIEARAFPSARGLSVFLRDITRDKEAEAALQAREERFRSLVQYATDLIGVLLADGRLTYVSPSAEQVLGYQPDALVGTSLLEYVHPADLAGVRAVLADAVANPGVLLPLEARLRHRDGSWRWIEAIARNLGALPSIGGMVINARDRTEHKRLEEQLTQQALYDPLTSLPNRALFINRLTQAIRRVARDECCLGVLLVDIDEFKLVNDSVGHQAGDALLIQVAQRCAAVVRPEDTVARFGADEFVVLLDGIDDALAATQVAERLHEAVHRPVQIEGREIPVTVSIGIALSTASDTHAADVLRWADIAMHRAKARGKNRFELFDLSMQAATLERLELAQQLRHAIDRDELVLHFQPIVQLASRAVVGYEALVRWQHPERGMLGPVAFISVAEETGLIVPLGQWVLREACWHAAQWNRTRSAAGPLSVSVNLSAHEFQRPELIGDVAEVLAESGVLAAWLTLEMTESVVMEDVATASTTLGALSALGVTLAIDDFGTGYSSLAYLKRFPVDVLKLDQAFVRDVAEDREDQAIVAATAGLAASLGLDLVAEGIETDAQLTRLRDLGCAFGQGYLFARPQPVERLTPGRLP